MADCVWLLRHGATEWTDDGRHTGREDVPLSDAGRDVGHGKQLRALAARWVGCSVAHGSVLPMDPAAICLLVREPGGPLLRLWNFTGQLVG